MYNAQGAKVFGAAAALLGCLHRKVEWAKAGDAWRAAFVPELQVILQRQGDVKSIWMCLYSTEYSCLVWPVKRTGARFIQLDMSVTSLQWVPIFTFEGLEVVPAVPVSPLHCFVKGDVEMLNLGCMLEHEGPVDLLKYQAQRAFAGVQEKHMKFLHADRKIELPASIDEDGLEYECALALSLMRRCDPDMDQPAMESALLKRAGTKCGTQNEEWSEWLASTDVEHVVTLSDRKALKEYHSTLEKVQSKRKSLQDPIKKAVQRKFGAGLPKPGGPKASASSAAKSAKDGGPV
jgi:hypothetical protein